MKRNEKKMKSLEPVLRYLQTLAPFETHDLAPFVGRYQTEIFKENDIIFSEGAFYNRVAFILEGLVKKYYLTSGGREFFKEFTWEGQITTPYASLLQGIPATYTMQALEGTRLFTMDYSVVKTLMETDQKWLRVGKALADFHFLNRENRERELLTHSAQDRYANFKKQFPHLLTRLKKQDIASYLGITPVSLSRLESVK